MNDSTGNTIVVGDRVRFRGQLYTIKSFHPGEGRSGEIAAIMFEEWPPHCNEIPDEWSVDKVVLEEPT